VSSMDGSAAATAASPAVLKSARDSVFRKKVKIAIQRLLYLQDEEMNEASKDTPVDALVGHASDGVDAKIVPLRFGGGTGKMYAMICWNSMYAKLIFQIVGSLLLLIVMDALSYKQTAQNSVIDALAGSSSASFGPDYVPVSSSAPSLVYASDVGVCAVSSSASALKAVSSSAPVRVRVVSSSATASDVARSLVPMLRLGCDDYLVSASDVGVCAVSLSASAFKAVSSSAPVRIRAVSSSATVSDVARSLAPILRLGCDDY
jgi:hypothetical protein